MTEMSSYKFWIYWVGLNYTKFTIWQLVNFVFTHYPVNSKFTIWQKVKILCNLIYIHYWLIFHLYIFLFIYSYSFIQLFIYLFIHLSILYLLLLDYSFIYLSIFLFRYIYFFIYWEQFFYLFLGGWGMILIIHSNFTANTHSVEKRYFSFNIFPHQWST